MITGDKERSDTDAFLNTPRRYLVIFSKNNSRNPQGLFRIMDGFSKRLIRIMFFRKQKISIKIEYGFLFFPYAYIT